MSTTVSLDNALLDLEEATGILRLLNKEYPRSSVEENLQKLKVFYVQKEKHDRMLIEMEGVLRQREERNKPEPVYSEELQKKIEEMMSNLPPHQDKYPPRPTSWDLVVPTGRNVTCICSPSCTKVLSQPEYRVLNKEEALQFGVVIASPAEISEMLGIGGGNHPMRTSSLKEQPKKKKNKKRGQKKRMH